MTDISITREEIEKILEENNFERGAAHEDPEKDATHVWVDRAGQRFVRFADKPEDEEGALIYGDASQGEAGVALRYDKAVLVLSGALTAKKAHKLGMQVPEGIFQKALGEGSAPALTIPKGDPLLGEEKKPKALGEKKKSKDEPAP
jgi:hypothetical protein